MDKIPFNGGTPPPGALQWRGQAAALGTPVVVVASWKPNSSSRGSVDACGARCAPSLSCAMLIARGTLFWNPPLKECPRPGALAARRRRRRRHSTTCTSGGTAMGVTPVGVRCRHSQEASNGGRWAGRFSGVYREERTHDRHPADRFHCLPEL